MKGVFHMIFKNDAPARLEKKMSIRESFENWCVRHTTIVLMVCFIIFAILFTALVFAIMGVSATESGLQYNQFKNII